MTHPDRDQRQSAFRVLVASSLEMLEQETGDKWDSGKVTSVECTQITYAGETLKSREICYWSVRVWDDKGQAGPYGPPASFEIGLLRIEDWSSRWVGMEGCKPGEALLFRREFQLKKQIVCARAFICGLGYYELRINGKKVGNHVLDPGWTEYSRTVLYVTYDVTSLVRPGANVVGVMLGNGWYGKPKLLFQLFVRNADGTEENLVNTDWNWLVSGGPILANSVYDGEVYDARLEKKAWDEPGYPIEPGQWLHAHAVSQPGGELRAQMLEPIRVVGTLDPVALTHPKPNIHVFDMGQIFAGWCRLTVSGPIGTEVEMRFAELLREDGTVNQDNLRTARATLKYVLKGAGNEVYEPRFTYFGFRYIQVTGYPGIPTLQALKGCIVRSSVRQAGTFSCSNELINRIHGAVVWTEASNLHSIPTDCPQRNERMGWLNDMTVRAEEAIFNFDLVRLYTKWLGDIRDAQDAATGAIPDTAPFRWGAFPGDPVDCYLFIAWYLYLYYGDRRILEDHFEGIQAWVDFLGSQTSEGIVTYTRYSDWCTPIRDCLPADTQELPIEHNGALVFVGSYPAVTPGILISTAYYYYNAILLSKIAAILGRTADQQKYARISDQTRTAFNKRFFHEETAQYATGSQGSNAMPLFLDLVPLGQTGRVLDNVVKDIVNTHSGHLNTGNQCTKYMAEALTRLGRGDVVHQFVTQTSYPSWGFMLQRGATTIWERWEEMIAGGMNSHCHPMLGSIDAWFYKYLAGIQADPDAPGWGRVNIRPYLLADMSHVEASLETIRGAISVKWQRAENLFRMWVTIPVNSEALVELPLQDHANLVVRESGVPVWKGGTFLAGVPGIHSGIMARERLNIEIGSGSYKFEVGA